MILEGLSYHIFLLVDIKINVQIVISELICSNFFSKQTHFIYDENQKENGYFFFSCYIVQNYTIAPAVEIRRISIDLMPIVVNVNGLNRSRLRVPCSASSQNPSIH